MRLPMLVGAGCMVVAMLSGFLLRELSGLFAVSILVGAAFMFIFLPLTLPAFILAKESRHLVLAAGLAGIAAFAYFALWLQLLDELGLGAAPWS